MLATTLDNSNKAAQEEQTVSRQLLALLLALSLIAMLALVLVLLYPISVHWAVVALASIVAAGIILARFIGFFRTRTQSSLLRASLTMMFVSVPGLIFYIANPGYGLTILSLPFISVTVAFLALAAYAWSSSRIAQGNKVIKGLDSAIGVGVIALLGFVLMLLMLFSPLHDFLLNRPGQAAPWSEQLSIAQREAKQADKDAVLAWVSASPVNPANPNYETPLKSFFYFESPSGKVPTIFLNELAPDLTDQSMGANGGTGVSSETDFEVLRGSAAAVKISASEALSRIKPEALALERERDVQLRPASVKLLLRGRSSENDATIPDSLPAVWEITLLGRNPYVFPIEYWVNAATGEIVKRDYGEFDVSRP